MNRMKRFFLISFVVATSLLVVGCGLVGSWRASSNVDVDLADEVPEWLTLAHRAQANDQPVIEPEEDDSNQGPATTPASTQPGTTQPPQQPAPQPSDTPKWQQPGTMEYIAKQQLDQLIFNYKRLNSEIAELEAKKDKTAIEVADLKVKIIDREKFYKDTLAEIAAGLGLSLEKEYGIKPPPAATTETTDSTWFQNWDESPSGFNKQ